MNIPITEPSEPFWINWDNIANGRAKILAHPIPAIAIQIRMKAVFVVYTPIPTKVNASVSKEIKCTFLLPNLVDSKPIGIETKKQIKFWIAKHIDEKFVAWLILSVYKALTSSVAVVKSGTPKTVWIAYWVRK